MQNKNILNYLGYPFNFKPYYQLFASVFLLTCLTSETITDILRHSVLLGNGLIMIYILKEKYKTPRPKSKQQLQIDYYPESYDIPSGHSFISIYWLLVLVYLKIPYTLPLIFYLGIIPFTRIMLGVHTINAVVFGSFLGGVWFLIWFLLQKLN